MNPAPGRLAFVCPRFAGESGAGGAETLLWELSRRLARAGRPVSFLTTCAVNHFTWADALPPGRRDVDGVEVRFFPVDPARDPRAFHAAQERISRGGPVPREVEDRWRKHSVNSPALIDHLETEAGRYERIVAGPYLFGVILAVAGRFPDRTILVPCLHDEPFARLPAVRETFHAVRGCLFNSEPERDLANRLYGFDSARGAIVGMGLDAFEADPRAFAAASGIEAPYVVYAGRREAAKDTPLLIDYVDAFRRRTGRDVRLVSCGSGGMERRDFVADLGFVTEARKREALAGAAAFAHPSRLESLGIALLEAFLAGVPGLVRAQSETLRWQCARSHGGLWWRAYPEFEEELIRLLDDPALRRALGRQGRAYAASEYSWAAVEQRLSGALARL